VAACKSREDENHLAVAQHACSKTTHPGLNARFDGGEIHGLFDDLAVPWCVRFTHLLHCTHPSKHTRRGQGIDRVQHSHDQARHTRKHTHTCKHNTLHSQRTGLRNGGAYLFELMERHSCSSTGCGRPRAAARFAFTLVAALLPVASRALLVAAPALEPLPLAPVPRFDRPRRVVRFVLLVDTTLFASSSVSSPPASLSLSRRRRRVSRCVPLVADPDPDPDPDPSPDAADADADADADAEAAAPDADPAGAPPAAPLAPSAPSLAADVAFRRRPLRRPAVALAAVAAVPADAAAASSLLPATSAPLPISTSPSLPPSLPSLVPTSGEPSAACSRASKSGACATPVANAAALGHAVHRAGERMEGGSSGPESRPTKEEASWDAGCCGGCVCPRTGKLEMVLLCAVRALVVEHNTQQSRRRQ